MTIKIYLKICGRPSKFADQNLRWPGSKPVLWPIHAAARPHLGGVVRHVAAALREEPPVARCVRRLELLCAQALQESVGPASAVPLLEAAHTTGDGRLLAHCRRFVADHAAEVRASGGVEQLRDFGVAKGLLGDALDQVAELKKGALRAAARTDAAPL